MARVSRCRHRRWRPTNRLRKSSVKRRRQKSCCSGRVYNSPRHGSVEEFFASAAMREREQKDMSSTAITTVVQILESLPDPVQAQVLEHLREYLLDLQDEMEWDAQFNRTQR